MQKLNLGFLDTLYFVKNNLFVPPTKHIYGWKEIKGSSRKVVGKKAQRCQCRLQVELMKTELAKMKGEIRDSSEWLLAAKIEANQTEAQLELLITIRNETMDNLLEMNATEAFLMHQLISSVSFESENNLMLYCIKLIITVLET